jgi:16S rRNA (guanine527-N7)-methyltransferase
VTPEEFAQAADVPRGTLEKIKEYQQLLEKWQRAVQLVAPSTLGDFWRRHALDSAQLWKLIKPEAPGVIADLGSGAGFPGLVLAIVAEGSVLCHLIESDTRKAAFLAEVVRATGARAQVHMKRAEALEPLRADVVTARALAPLDRLLDLATPLLAPNGVCWFLKGARVDEEIASAERNWSLALARFPSISDASGVILRIVAQRRASPKQA